MSPYSPPLVGSASLAVSCPPVPAVEPPGVVGLAGLDVAGAAAEVAGVVVVGADDVDAAVRAAHTAFGLDSVSGEAVVYAGTGR